VSVYPLENFMPGVRVIELTQGQSTIVDEEDFERLSAFKWWAQFLQARRCFVVTGYVGNNIAILMHRFIIGAQPGEITDHINLNPLDNRKTNLRKVTKRQNNLNMPLLRSDNRSGFRGVSWFKNDKKWAASIHFNNHKIHLGYFTTPEAAARAYDAGSKKYHEGFGPLNFPR
jgi:hypothetical protein